MCFSLAADSITASGVETALANSEDNVTSDDSLIFWNLKQAVSENSNNTYYFDPAIHHPAAIPSPDATFPLSFPTSFDFNEPIFLKLTSPAWSLTSPQIFQKEVVCDQ